MTKVVGVRFKKACKIYDFDPNGLELIAGDKVIVETEKGMGLGFVARGILEKNEASLVQPLKKVIRKATENDMERLEFNKEMEVEATNLCKTLIAKYHLPMKLVRVEYLFDSSKVIFAFISEERVDFRELVRDLANELHIRIEMRQIGVRDEAKFLGGLGPCGRTFCCSTHMVDFEPVSVKMAKEQNISLNPAKLSGICGRLMCCLTYELPLAGGETVPNSCESCQDKPSAPPEA